MISFPTTLDGLYINGQWSAGREHLRVINPATEALLTTVNGGDEHAVEQAVAAATAAFKDWSQTSGAERGAILRNIANGVRNGRDHLMNLQSSNNGKPQFEAAIDVDDVIATFEYYAELAEGLDARQDSNVPLPSDDFSARLRREPCGVVETRPGAGRRVLRGAEAIGSHAAARAGAGGDHRRSRPAHRRVQRRLRYWSGGRCTTVGGSAHRQDFLHR
jgi:hypothetical protein